MERPKCPYCGHEFTDEEIWYCDCFPHENQEEKSFRCSICDEWLTVIYDPIPNWVFVDGDDNEIKYHAGA